MSAAEGRRRGRIVQRRREATRRSDDAALPGTIGKAARSFREWLGMRGALGEDEEAPKVAALLDAAERAARKRAAQAANREEWERWADVADRSRARAAALRRMVATLRRVGEP